MGFLGVSGLHLYCGLQVLRHWDDGIPLAESLVVLAWMCFLYADYVNDSRGILAQYLGVLQNCLALVWPSQLEKTVVSSILKMKRSFFNWDTPICWKHPSISPWNPKNTEKKIKEQNARLHPTLMTSQATPHVRYPHEKQSLKGLLTISCSLNKAFISGFISHWGYLPTRGARLTGHETPQTCRQRPASVAGARLRPAQREGLELRPMWHWTSKISTKTWPSKWMILLMVQKSQTTTWDV